MQTQLTVLLVFQFGLCAMQHIDNNIEKRFMSVKNAQTQGKTLFERKKRSSTECETTGLITGSNHPVASTRNPHYIFWMKPGPEFRKISFFLKIHATFKRYPEIIEDTYLTLTKQDFPEIFENNAYINITIEQFKYDIKLAQDKMALRGYVNMGNKTSSKTVVTEYWWRLNTFKEILVYLDGNAEFSFKCNPYGMISINNIRLENSDKEAKEFELFDEKSIPSILLILLVIVIIVLMSLIAYVVVHKTQKKKNNTEEYEIKSISGSKYQCDDERIYEELEYDALAVLRDKLSNESEGAMGGKPPAVPPPTYLNMNNLQDFGSLWREKELNNFDYNDKQARISMKDEEFFAKMKSVEYQSAKNQYVDMKSINIKDKQTEK